MGCGSSVSPGSGGERAALGGLFGVCGDEFLSAHFSFEIYKLTILEDHFELTFAPKVLLGASLEQVDRHELQVGLQRRIGLGGRLFAQRVPATATHDRVALVEYAAAEVQADDATSGEVGLEPEAQQIKHSLLQGGLLRELGVRGGSSDLTSSGGFSS
jgi:hypothetical protein